MIALVDELGKLELQVAVKKNGTVGKLGAFKLVNDSSSPMEMMKMDEEEEDDDEDEDEDEDDGEDDQDDDDDDDDEDDDDHGAKQTYRESIPWKGCKSYVEMIVLVNL